MLLHIIFDEKIEYTGNYEEATESVTEPMQYSESNAYSVAFREKALVQP